MWFWCLFPLRQLPRVQLAMVLGVVWGSAGGVVRVSRPPRARTFELFGCLRGGLCECCRWGWFWGGLGVGWGGVVRVLPARWAHGLLSYLGVSISHLLVIC